MPVGNAPWHDFRRRTVRAETNPMDKSTVVSIYPVAIHEVKPTIFPGVFDVPAGSFENPAVLIVGPSSWWREVGEDEPLLEISVSSVVMADSIVKDYANGLIESNMNDVMPGIFFVPGAKSIEQIKKEFAPQLERAKVKQDNWYRALIKMADILWSRTNGNPLAISNDMRLAAQELHLTKDWMQDFTTIEKIQCKACGNLNNSTVVVCPNCKVVLNDEKFKKLGLQFAS